ncbi:hypothetical protein LUZ60_006670 [Juncus effusus]|nr:hypothetical protein LUZ60_006670 [Juncus effusus]
MKKLIRLLDIYNAATVIDPHSSQITWRWGSRKCYSAKEVYKRLNNPGVTVTWHSPLWKMHAPLKIKVFLWLLIHNKLLTADNLAKRNWPRYNRCKLCNRDFESASHLFFNCIYARAIWTHSFASWNVTFRSTNLLQIWLDNRKHFDPIQAKRWDATCAATMWSHWRERNNRIFNSKSKPHKMISKEIRDLVDSWMENL